jgi:phospholipid N-methyltransferase
MSPGPKKNKGRSRATRKILEVGRFLGEVGRNWRATGALLPSSRHLARAMCAPLAAAAARARPHRILEIGAGTGVVTHEIVRQMRPEDHLVIYELSEDMAQCLDERIVHDPEWRARSIELRIAAFPDGLEDERYDVAVCSLPFNNFPSTAVRRAFEAFAKTLADGGHLTFFEYCMIRRVKLRVADRKEFFRLQRIDRILQEYLIAHRISHMTVHLNVPPAWVHTLKFE